jgi:hypothetical protein
MVIMIDENFDRDYRAGRDALNASILGFATRLGAAFGNAFKVLNRIEYSAPWAAKPKRARTH